jgi:hypothetical protein
MADFNIRRGTPEELQVELLGFERRYGVSSARMATAFDAPHESSDEHRWATVYALLQRIGRLPANA